MRNRLAALVLSLAPALWLAASPSAEATRHRVGGPRAAALPAAPAPVVEEPTPPELGAYRVLTIRDFVAGEAVAGGPREALPVELADRLAEAVGASEQLGLEVRRGEPLGRADEMVLDGTVEHARKGNRLARVLVGPLARARLVVDFELSEAAGGELLDSGTVKKLWAMPGWSGAIRGLNGLENGVCREVVRYLEDAGAGTQPRPAATAQREPVRAAR